MSVIGIVCEYNPFHKGHKYLIDSVKTENDTVVAVMSGNFVQRAEPALFPKETRVKAALRNGVDIVIELPFVYAVASAEIFADSAVTLLDAMGCDKIAFGAENDNLTALSEAANVLASYDFDKKVKAHLEKGVSYSAARQLAFNEYDMICDISSPNNILALEYLKAVKKLSSKIVPVAVKREGAGYNDMNADGDFASATYIRECFLSNKTYEKYIPSNCAELYGNSDYFSPEKYNLAALTLLRSRLNDDLSNTANMAEGLQNRIKTAVKECVTLNEVYDTVKTKRFAHSRIRRAAISAMFDIKKSDIKIPVPYCRLLGFNEIANGVLGALAVNCKLPFAASYKNIRNLNSANASRIFELEDKSTDFYNLILQNSLRCSAEMTYTPIKLK